MDLSTIPPLGVLAATTAPDWQSIVSLAASAMAVLGVVYTASRTRASSREANSTTKESTAVTTAEKLWARVEQVDAARQADRKAWEDERDDLRGRLDNTNSMLTVSLEYIEDLVQDIRAAGVRLVRRPPRELRDRLAHVFDADHEKEG